MRHPRFPRISFLSIDRIFAHLAFFLLLLAPLANRADTPARANAPPAPPQSAEELMQRLHDTLQKASARYDEVIASAPPAATASSGSSVPVIDLLASGKSVTVASPPSASRAKTLDSYNTDWRNARFAAEAAYDSLCETYPAFEAIFDTQATTVAGWPEVRALAQKIHSDLKSKDGYRGGSFRTPSASDECWSLVFGERYDDILKIRVRLLGNPDGVRLADYEQKTSSPDLHFITAYICTCLATNDCTHAANTALSVASKGFDDPMLYALAARAAAKASRIDDAREQCQILLDLFPQAHWPDLARQIASQYHFTLEARDADYIATRYIESGKPAFRMRGLIALGWRKFPDAFERLSHYYQNPTAPNLPDKQHVMQGMAASADQRSIDFLLQVALSKPAFPKPNSFAGLDKDDDFKLADMAFTALCDARATDAVLDYISQSQNSLSRLIVLDSQNSRLRNLFGDGPAPEDTEHPTSIGCRQWVKWLRETGRIQPLPAPPQPPPLPFPEIDLRRTTHAWFFAQLDTLRKATAQLDRCAKGCALASASVTRKAEGKNTPPQAAAAAVSGTKKPASPFGGSAADMALASIRAQETDQLFAFGIFKISTRPATRLALNLPATFPPEAQAHYAPLAEKARALIAGLSECATLYDTYKATQDDDAKTAPTLKQLSAKLATLAALRAEIFPKNFDPYLTVITLADNLEIVRTLGIEACLKNMQRARSLFATMNSMLSPNNPSSQTYTDKILAKARDFITTQRTAAESLKANPDVEREYLDYCDSCDRFVDTISPLLKNIATSPIDAAQETKMYVARAQETDERAKSLALVAIAAARQTSGAFLLYPPSHYRYASIQKIKDDLATFQKTAGEFLKYLGWSHSLSYVVTSLLKNADIWVKENKSAGKYDSFKLYSPTLTKPLALDTNPLGNYITADETQTLQDACALWNRKRDEMNSHLATLKTILDTESYKTDNAVAYDAIKTTLRATVADDITTLKQIAATTQSIFASVGKRIADANGGAPALVQTPRAALLLATPLATDDLYFDAAPFNPSHPQLDPVSARKLTATITDLRNKLQTAIATDKTNAAAPASPPLRDSLGIAQAAARDTLSDMNDFLRLLDAAAPPEPSTTLAIKTSSKADTQDIQDSINQFVTLAELPCLVYWENLYIDEDF